MRLPCLAAAVLALACSTEPNLEEVDARTTKTAYVTPGDITVEVSNNSSVTLYSGLCPVSLERRVGETWDRTTFDRACPMIPIPLPSGGTISPTFAIPEAMAAGEYRLVIGPVETEDGESIGTLLTNLFRID